MSNKLAKKIRRGSVPKKKRKPTESIYEEHVKVLVKMKAGTESIFYKPKNIQDPAVFRNRLGQAIRSRVYPVLKKNNDNRRFRLYVTDTNDVVVRCVSS